MVSEKSDIETDKGKDNVNPLDSKNIERLTLGLTLLQFLDAGLSPAQISRALKCSRSNITQRIQRLLVLGFITDLKTWPKRYVLTDLGKANVNSLLMHDDKAHPSPSKFYDLHAIEISYELADRGDLPQGNVDLKGWSYYAEKFGDFSIKVNYGKKNKLIIYPPHIEGNSVIEVYSKLGFTVANIVDLIQARYKCEVKPETYHIQKRPEVHATLDPLGKVFEAQELDQKGKNIEINQSGDAHFDIIGERSFQNYDSMIGIFPDFMNKIQEFAKQLNVHIPSVKALGEGSQELSAQVKQLNVGVSELIRAAKGMQNFQAPQIANLSVKTDDPLVHVQIIEPILSFVAEDRGIIREYPDLNMGSRIWLPRSVAEVMINQNKAKAIGESAL
jgi:DNA-binding Lrp family transcriptional regulator